jgi:hypothetical protein
VPPNQAGRFPEPDVSRLYAFRAALDSLFANNHAAFRPATASDVRAGNENW